MGRGGIPGHLREAGRQPVRRGGEESLHLMALGREISCLGEHLAHVLALVGWLCVPASQVFGRSLALSWLPFRFHPSQFEKGRASSVFCYTSSWPRSLGLANAIAPPASLTLRCHSLLYFKSILSRGSMREEWRRLDLRRRRGSLFLRRCRQARRQATHCGSPSFNLAVLPREDGLLCTAQRARGRRRGKVTHLDQGGRGQGGQNVKVTARAGLRGQNFIPPSSP